MAAVLEVLGNVALDIHREECCADQETAVELPIEKEQPASDRAPLPAIADEPGDQKTRRKSGRVWTPAAVACARREDGEGGCHGAS